MYSVLSYSHEILGSESYCVCPDLCFGSVMVQSSEGSEVLVGDGGSKVGADHGIGVGWVTHH